VAALLTVGADPNISSRVFEHEDIVPLAIAAAKNDVKIVHALLDAGAVKHWMDASGRSPLMYAARCSSVSPAISHAFPIHSLPQIFGAALLCYVGGLCEVAGRTRRGPERD
jgi:Ankyrin repeats (3 copies)